MDLQLPVQSVPITTKVVCSNPIHGEVYSIQHYVTGQWFSQLTPVSSASKTDHYDITVILLKVVLNTIIPYIEQLYNRIIVINFWTEASFFINGNFSFIFSIIIYSMKNTRGPLRQSLLSLLSRLCFVCFPLRSNVADYLKH